MAVTKSTNQAHAPPTDGALTSPAGVLVPNVLSYLPASLLQSTVMNRLLDMYCVSVQLYLGEIDGIRDRIHDDPPA